jgi:hypothetical protein
MKQQEVRSSKKEVKRLKKAGKTNEARLLQERIDAHYLLIESKKASDKVKAKKEIPVMVIENETPPAVDTAKDEKSSEVLDGAKSSPCEGKGCENIPLVTATPAPCDTDSQEEKKGKKAIEAEARDSNYEEGMEKYNTFKNKLAEDSTKERENEKTEVISSDPSETESATESEGSNPTDLPDKDSSDGTTTSKVEPKVEEKSPLPWGKGEVPWFVETFIDRGWLKSHGSVEHPAGGKIELHANLGFDDNGNSREIPFTDIERPDTSKMTPEEVVVARQEYDKRLTDARLRRANTLMELYKKFDKMMPTLMHMHSRTVHCWNKKSEKKLNLTGTFVGLQGGKNVNTILIDGTGHDGKAKKIRRGYRYISLDLPDGITASPTVKLKDVKDVEKVADKLLTDKRSGSFSKPVGYDTAIRNLTREQEYVTILVWNHLNQQMAFFASPIDLDNVKTDYRWLSFNFENGERISIHNDVIAMQGSVSGLLRVTTKVYQENVDNMLIVSIPKDDSAQLASLMAVLDTGTVLKGKDSEEERTLK